MAEENVYLVAGASGQLGGLVLQALVDAGAPRIMATTRTPAKLSRYAEKGVDVRAADYTKPKEELLEAFRGATHMLLISTQEVGARFEHHLKALHAAIEAGVRHIFYTSHSHPDTSTSPVAGEHGKMEKAIKDTGVTYTMLRNFLYSENVLLSMAEAAETGKHFGITGDGKVSWISRSDIAAAAAAAMLTAEDHENKTYDITGPRAYSNLELVAAVSKALRREIEHFDLSPEEYEARLVGIGLSPEIAKTMTGLEHSNRLGDHDLVNDVFKQLTGREPEKLEDFLSVNAVRIDPAVSITSLLDQHAKS